MKIIHRKETLKMSHQANDQHQENIGLFFHGAISNIKGFKDQVEQWELEGFMSEPEKTYLNKLVQATEEFLIDERQSESTSVS
jgi:hypothetical protein